MPKLDYSLAPPPDVVEPAFFSSQIKSARRFTIDLSPSRSASLVVVCGGSERCASDFQISRATFKYFCIEFVVAGRGLLYLNGKKHPLGPGDLFVYGPHISHVIKSDPHEHLVKYFVNFSGRQACRLLCDNGLMLGSIVQTSSPDEIRRLFDELIVTGQRRGPRGPALCAALVEQIVLRTFETLIPTGSLGGKAFATFTTCRTHIKEHYLALTDVRQVADACSVNVSYMCRLFQRFARQSPYQFLIRQRMTAAAEMLGETGVLVKQVAERMGYSDPFHFSRAFRKVYGLAPLHFQRFYNRREHRAFR